MILKITSNSISPGNPSAKPEPSEDYYYVKVTDVPEGVSVGQVILLFDHTAREVAEKARPQCSLETRLLPPAGGSF